MKNIPDRIFLQVDPEGEKPADFKDLEGISWCEDRINDNDIAYVREKLPNTTRIEVIDQTGRAYTNWHKSKKIELSLQDEGRTLKVLLTTQKEPHQITQEIKMQALILKGHKMKRETWVRTMMEAFPDTTKEEAETTYDKIYNPRPPLDS
jgi:hypothetical protein